jgi:hypothetical protein
MNEVTRRNAMKMLAGGTVLATGTLAATPRAADPLARPAARAPGAVPVDNAAWRVETGQTPAATSPVAMATVSRCRSWDGSVYLHAGPELCGYVQLTPQAFALAAACQAAERPIAMRHWGHDPRWAGGAGRFAGVVLAIDRRDFGETDHESATLS